MPLSYTLRAKKLAFLTKYKASKSALLGFRRHRLRMLSLSLLVLACGIDIPKATQEGRFVGWGSTDSMQAMCFDRDQVRADQFLEDLFKELGEEAPKAPIVNYIFDPTGEILDTCEGSQGTCLFHRRSLFRRNIGRPTIVTDGGYFEFHELAGVSLNHLLGDMESSFLEMSFVIYFGKDLHFEGGCADTMSPKFVEHILQAIERDETDYPSSLAFGWAYASSFGRQAFWQFLKATKHMRGVEKFDRVSRSMFGKTVEEVLRSKVGQETEQWAWNLCQEDSTELKLGEEILEVPLPNACDRFTDLRYFARMEGEDYYEYSFVIEVPHYETVYARKPVDAGVHSRGCNSVCGWELFQGIGATLGEETFQSNRIGGRRRVFVQYPLRDGQSQSMFFSLTPFE